jgi:flagellar biosynthesis/type III secretory pathway protein FliH
MKHILNHRSKCGEIESDLQQIYSELCKQSVKAKSPQLYVNPTYLRTIKQKLYLRDNKLVRMKKTSQSNCILNLKEGEK